MFKWGAKKMVPTFDTAGDFVRFLLLLKVVSTCVSCVDLTGIVRPPL